MDVGSPERFEIELDEQPTKRARLRRNRTEPTPPPITFQPPPPGDAMFTPAAAPEQPAVSPERNRLIVTALAVGAVALFLGWSLGRAGGGDGDEAAQTGGTTATTLADAPTVPTTVAPADTLPEAELPTTTRPRPTTTTTEPPAWVRTQVEIDPRLAGQAARIVGVGDGGSLIELDLATGDLQTLERSRPSGNTALPPVVGADWVVVTFDDGRTPLVYRDGDVEPTQLQSQDPWSLLWDPVAGTYWERRWDEFGVTMSDLEEMSIDGEPTGRSIETRGLWTAQLDYTGGVIIGDGSIGAFRVTPEGSERMADGYVVAAGVNHLLVYACAENFDSCAMSVVDRASGASRIVDADDELAMRLVTSGGWWGIPTTPEINVDGTAALVAFPDERGQPTTGVLDLVTGELVEIERDPGSSLQSFTYPSGAWSADGRFAFLVSDDTIAAYDRTTRDVFPVVPGGLDGVRALSVRPA